MPFVRATLWPATFWPCTICLTFPHSLLPFILLRTFFRTILSKAQIAELKAGTLNKSLDAVVINTHAYPYYLKQAADFSKLDRYRIHFNDPFGLTMLRLYPRIRTFTYQATKTAIYTVPSDYVHYEFRLNSIVEFSDEQLDALFTYKQAETLVLFNNRGDFATRLLERIDNWSNWQSLQGLHLEVTKQSLSQLQMHPFMERLPSLRSISFHLLGFEAREIPDALQNQTTPDGWVREVNPWKRMVQFYKKDFWRYFPHLLNEFWQKKHLYWSREPDDFLCNFQSKFI